MAKEQITSSLTLALQGMNVPGKKHESSIGAVENEARKEESVDQSVKANVGKKNNESNNISEPKKNDAVDKKVSVKTSLDSPSQNKKMDTASEQEDGIGEEMVNTGLRLQSECIMYLKLKAVQNQQTIINYFNNMISDYFSEKKPIDVSAIIQKSKTIKDKESLTIYVTASNREKLKENERNYGIKTSVFVNYLIYTMMKDDKNNPLKL